MVGDLTGLGTGGGGLRLIFLCRGNYKNKFAYIREKKTLLIIIITLIDCFLGVGAYIAEVK